MTNTHSSAEEIPYFDDKQNPVAPGKPTVERKEEVATFLNIEPQLYIWGKATRVLEN